MGAEFQARGHRNSQHSETLYVPPLGQEHAVGDIELSKLSLSAEKLASLPEQERYVFALAGHIFNEAMMLQKLAITSHPSDDAHPFVADAAVGSALFVLRILVGKTEEAMRILTKESVEQVLRGRMFSHVAGLNEKWTEAIDRYGSLTWLGQIRNSRAFHYMNSAQWAPHLGPDICQDAHVIVGKTHGNTYFHWNDLAAALPMMMLVDPGKPFDGLEIMLKELNALLKDICGCLAQGLQHFMLEYVTEDEALGDPQHVNAPVLAETHLTYFFSLGAL